jgi:hypothetical protein
VTAPEPTVLAVELSELRGEIRTGLADIKGSLAVLVERTNRTDQDVRQLRIDHETALKELKDDVEALKARRFPLAVISAVAGAVGAGAGLAALFIK